MALRVFAVITALTNLVFSLQFDPLPNPIISGDRYTINWSSGGANTLVNSSLQSLISGGLRRNQSSATLSLWNKCSNGVGRGTTLPPSPGALSFQGNALNRKAEIYTVNIVGNSTNYVWTFDSNLDTSDWYCFELKGADGIEVASPKFQVQNPPSSSTSATVATTISTSSSPALISSSSTPKLPSAPVVISSSSRASSSIPPVSANASITTSSTSDIIVSITSTSRTSSTSSTFSASTPARITSSSYSTPPTSTSTASSSPNSRQSDQSNQYTNPDKILGKTIAGIVVATAGFFLILCGFGFWAARKAVRRRMRAFSDNPRASRLSSANVPTTRQPMMTTGSVPAIPYSRLTVSSAEMP